MRIAILLPFLTAAGLFAQPESYSLTGRLLFQDGQPVARAEVSLLDFEWKKIGEPVSTDASGNFAFHTLPSGTFQLHAERPDMGTFIYGQSAKEDTVMGMTLDRKSPSQQVVFSIDRPGTITGIVRDNAGDPMPGVSITNARRIFDNGKTAAMDVNRGGGRTDDQGRFHIPYVRPGRYRVCTSLFRDHDFVPPVGFAEFGQKPNQIYANTCVPESPSDTWLRVEPGSRVAVELRLEAGSPTEVSGRVLNLGPNGSAHLTLRSAERTFGWSANANPLTTTAADQFHFENVAQGHYWLTAEASETRENRQIPATARIPLTVGTSNVNGLELQLAPAPEIDVVVHAPKSAEPGTIELRDADNPQHENFKAEQSNGSWKIKLPYPGRFWLSPRTSGCASKASFNNDEALRQAILVPPGARGKLEVTITQECGTVNAFALDEDGKPVPFARTLILFTGTVENPGDLMIVNAEEDGRSSYSGLPPGVYSLWSWRDETEQRGDIDDLPKLRAWETKVEVSAGETKAVRISVIGTRSKGNK